MLSSKATAWTAMALTAGVGLIVARFAQASTGTTFSTGDSQITPGVDNRGWWSATVDNDDHEDDYSVGRRDGEEVRSFFTFDLSAVTAVKITAAKLELQCHSGWGGTIQRLGIFDVATDPWELNRNTGTSPKIFEDLGSGVLYGRFDVSTDQRPDSVLSLALGPEAIDDMNEARGGFFSIGAALLTMERADTLADELLFARSSGPGVQRLVVCLEGDPDGDEDGVCDGIDNCSQTFNPDQRDADLDGEGDRCDRCPSGESDADGICDDSDNCPLTDNREQVDSDADGLGDACDNCPGVANRDQADRNGDGLGDACETRGTPVSCRPWPQCQRTGTP